MTPANIALLRLEVLAWRHIDTRNQVLAADLATSVADARAAHNLARGIPARHIDPASGTDLSPRAYRKARATWTPLTAAAGLDLWLMKAPHVVTAVEQAEEAITR